MYAPLLDSLQHVVSRAGRRTYRRSLVQVTGALAIAGVLTAALLCPAAGDLMGPMMRDFKPLTLDFVKLQCLNETDDWNNPDGSNDDEPYAVMFAADISGVTPQCNTVRTKVFKYVDAGQTHWDTQRLWPVDGSSEKWIQDPDNLIFLVALMESDALPNSEAATRANAVRDTVQSHVAGRLALYAPNFKTGLLSRSAMIEALRGDMDQAIHWSRAAVSDDDEDDSIGRTLELRVNGEDVVNASLGRTVEKKLRFWANDGGDVKDYLLYFALYSSHFIAVDSR